MKPHGQAILNWQKHRLLVQAIGPFNKEGIDIAFDAVKNTVNKKGVVHWDRLDISNEETLGEPSVMNVFAHSYIWSFEHGCQALALICCNVVQKNLCEKFVSNHDYNARVFSNEKSAVEWLDSLSSS